MALVSPRIYDPTYYAWPELRQETRILSPVRVGMDRKTGKVLVGWPHVVQSLTVIFQTRFHERVLRRWVGSFVPHLLGENTVERTVMRFYWAVVTSIDLWEPNYSVTQVRVAKRANDTELTSVNEIRQGHLQTRNEGVYRPRGHLGDPTPESIRSVGLIRDRGTSWTAQY